MGDVGCIDLHFVHNSNPTTAFDPIAKIPKFKVCAVKIEKVG
jgi:hypothetical protein